MSKSLQSGYFAHENRSLIALCIRRFSSILEQFKLRHGGVASESSFRGLLVLFFSFFFFGVVNVCWIDGGRLFVVHTSPKIFVAVRVKSLFNRRGLGIHTLYPFHK